MTEEEFNELLGEAYLEHLAKRREGNYIVDPEKASVVIQVLDYCQTLADKNEGAIEYSVVREGEEFVEIALRFANDLIIGDEKNNMKSFISTLSQCKAININGTGLEDGSFLISFFIDNPYQKVEENHIYTDK